MIVATRGPRPEHGDLKVVTKFAWFPAWVGEKKVWLCKYQILYEYIVKERWMPPMIGSIPMPNIKIRCGAWGKTNEKIL